MGSSLAGLSACCLHILSNDSDDISDKSFAQSTLLCAIDSLTEEIQIRTQLEQNYEKINCQVSVEIGVVKCPIPPLLVSKKKKKKDF